MDVYLTGDKHGSLPDYYRVIDTLKMHEVKNDNLIVILGDAGINYDNGEHDRELKENLNKSKCKFFIIQGNHEQRPEGMPDKYHLIDYMGAKGYVEDKYPNIIFGKDGEIYDFNGLSVLVVGGAYSVDKHYRIAQGLKWFADEQMNDEQKQLALDNLNKRNWKVDVVLSHTCPKNHIPSDMFLQGLDQDSVDRSMEEFLQEIEDKLDYTHWYCGHWHTDRVIDKIRFMFNGIVLLEQY